MKSIKAANRNLLYIYILHEQINAISYTPSYTFLDLIGIRNMVFLFRNI